MRLALWRVPPHSSQHSNILPGSRNSFSIDARDSEKRIDRRQTSDDYSAECYSDGHKVGRYRSQVGAEPDVEEGKRVCDERYDPPEVPNSPRRLGSNPRLDRRISIVQPRYRYGDETRDSQYIRDRIGAIDGSDRHHRLGHRVVHQSGRQMGPYGDHNSYKDASAEDCSEVNECSDEGL